MSVPILQTKLFIPSPRAQMVRRDQLVERLRAASAHRLILISAPAGFGKTTLVGAWLAERAGAVAWLSLEEDDNDVTRFLTYVIAALQTCQPTLGATAQTLLATPQAPPPKAVLTMLLNDLGELATPLALVFDDYHVIHTPVLHEAMTFLVDNLPPMVQLVINSRIDPPLPLARWRVRNHLTEVRADDLRFTPPEALSFLNDVMGLTLSTADVDALETRTEGWVAGLQLAALSLQGRADVTGFIQAFSGSHRHVLSYLVEEVLDRCPTGTLEFLLQTSLLDQMCAPLCAAVTDRQESQTVLEQLELANLFLIPLDDTGEWYRYHHLFADVLRFRLRQTQPEIIPQLHERASSWYFAAGQIEQAVGHALAMPDVEQAANLVEQVALRRILQHGDVFLVRRLVERLPVTTVYPRPQLTLAYGLALALTGQFAAVEALMAQARANDSGSEPASAPPTTALADEVVGGLTLLRATVARFRDDPDSALALAQQAVGQLPADSQMLHAGAALTIGAAQLQRGESLAGQRALASAVELGIAGGASNITMAALEELATDQARRGQLRQAKQTCEEALTQAARWNAQTTPTAGMAYIGIGEVLLEWNDLAGANQMLTHGLHLLRQSSETTMLARGYSALARRQWANDEHEQAFATLHQGTRWLTELQSASPRARAWLAAQEIRLHLWQGDLSAALRWDQTVHPVVDSLLAVFQQLTRARVRLAQHRHDNQASHLIEASALLAGLLNTAESKGWTGYVIEILLLQALAERAQDQRGAAQSTLTRTLTLAEPAGYLRTWVEEGEPLRLLLWDIRLWLARQPLDTQQQRLSRYIDQIIAVFDQMADTKRDQAPQADTAIQSPKTKNQNLLDPLTERELEVLRLVNDGLSNSEMAERMIVTVGTVKKHLNNIFSKLGVTSRTQALVCARVLDLL